MQGASSNIEFVLVAVENNICGIILPRFSFLHTMITGIHHISIVLLPWITHPVHIFRSYKFINEIYLLLPLLQSYIAWRCISNMPQQPLRNSWVQKENQSILLSSIFFPDDITGKNHLFNERYLFIYKVNIKVR